MDMERLRTSPSIPNGSIACQEVIEDGDGGITSRSEERMVGLAGLSLLLCSRLIQRLCQVSQFGQVARYPFSKMRHK
jgi:hypothetical protein